MWNLAAMTRERKARPVLPKPFARILWSQVLSHFGDDFEEVAVVVFALQVSGGNPAALGLLLAMTILPVALFGWAAAGVVDRWHKRRFMVAADLVRAALVLSIPLANSLPWAMAAVFCAYLIEVAYRATVQAVGPELAGDPGRNAVGMARLGQGNALGDILAYLASTGFILTLGLTAAFALDAFTFLVSAWLVWTTSAPERVWLAESRGARKATDAEGRAFLAQVGEAAHHIRKTPFLRALFLLTVPVALATATVNVLLGPSIAELWDRPTAEYGWLQLGVAVGVLLGMRLMERLVGRWPFTWILGGSAIGFGLTTAFYPVAGSIAAAIAISFLGGLANAGFQMPSVVWIQERTAHEIRARVLIFRRVVGGLGAAAGSIGGGWVAELVSLAHVYWAAAAVMVASGALILGAPALRAAARPAAAEPATPPDAAPPTAEPSGVQDSSPDLASLARKS